MDIKLENLFYSLIYEEKIEKKYNFRSEVSILVIKSLLPSKYDMGVRVDYKRLGLELDLWELYRTSYNRALYNVSKISEELYSYYDSSIFSRIVPIIIVNTDYDIMVKEVIKNILLTNASPKGLLVNLVIASGIYFYSLGYTDLRDRLKDIIINLSQSELIEEFYSYYRYKIYKSKKYTIEFERVRLDILNYLNGLDIGSFSELKEVIGLLEGDNIDPISFEARVVSRFLSGENLDLDPIYLSLRDYLSKLRSGRIDPDYLVISDYILPDIFKLNKGDRSYHSLLGELEVISKELLSKKIRATIRTKSGIYVLEK